MHIASGVHVCVCVRARVCVCVCVHSHTQSLYCFLEIHILHLRLPGRLNTCSCLFSSHLLLLLSHSVVSDSVTPWTVAHQAPLSMGFCRQEPWSGLSFPSPGDLPNPGIEPKSPAFQAYSLPCEPPGSPLGRKALIKWSHMCTYKESN